MFYSLNVIIIFVKPNTVILADESDLYGDLEEAFPLNKNKFEFICFTNQKQLTCVTDRFLFRITLVFLLGF